MANKRMTCHTCGDPVDINGLDGIALTFRNSKDGKRTFFAAFCKIHVPENPELVSFPELDEPEG